MKYPTTYDAAHPDTWDFRCAPCDKIILNGEITPATLDAICELLRNNGRVALVAANPEKISCARLVADLLINKGGRTA